MAEEFEVDEEQLERLRKEREEFTRKEEAEGRARGRKWAACASYAVLAKAVRVMGLDPSGNLEDEVDIEGLKEAMEQGVTADLVANASASWWEGFATGLLDVYHQV